MVLVSVQTQQQQQQQQELQANNSNSIGNKKNGVVKNRVMSLFGMTSNSHQVGSDSASEFEDIEADQDLEYDLLACQFELTPSASNDDDEDDDDEQEDLDQESGDKFGYGETVSNAVGVAKAIKNARNRQKMSKSNNTECAVKMISTCCTFFSSNETFFEQEKDCP